MPCVVSLRGTPHRCSWASGEPRPLAELLPASQPFLTGPSASSPWVCPCWSSAILTQPVPPLPPVSPLLSAVSLSACHLSFLQVSFLSFSSFFTAAGEWCGFGCLLVNTVLLQRGGHQLSSLFRPQVDFRADEQQRGGPDHGLPWRAEHGREQPGRPDQSHHRGRPAAPWE